MLNGSQRNPIIRDCRIASMLWNVLENSKRSWNQVVYTVSPVGVGRSHKKFGDDVMMCMKFGRCENYLFFQFEMFWRLAIHVNLIIQQSNKLLLLRICLIFAYLAFSYIQKCSNYFQLRCLARCSGACCFFNCCLKGRCFKERCHGF